MVYKLLSLLLIFSLFSCKSLKNKKEQPQTSATENKKNEAIANAQERDNKLIAMGYDFMAFGVSPSWTLRIDFDNNIAELTLQNTETIVYELNHRRDNYLSSLEFYGSKSLSLRTNEFSCYDKETGEGYPYSLSLEFDGQELHGCGKHLAENTYSDFVETALFQEWQVIEFKGVILEENKSPTLRLNPNRRMASGFSSCNQFQGNYALDGEHIKFGTLTMTHKYCGDNLEIDFMQALNSARTYRIENNQLVFLNQENKEVLRFVPR